MKRRVALALTAGALAMVGCTTTDAPPAPNTLVAARAAAAPVLDGSAGEAAWAAAKPLNLKLEDGANFGGKGETSATIKSVVVGDMIYFLIQYADPTMSMQRGPFKKQPDGTWIKLKDPADKGGDDNIYYEDKWAIIWNISMSDFPNKGCAATCHVGQGKPYGNKYATHAGQLGDIWHSKGARTLPFGLVDDQYLDATRYEPKNAASAGRKNEPGGPDYKGFGLVNGKPEFMNRDAKAANAGGTYWVKEGDQVPFVDNFKPGDEVASYIVFPLKGDRGDVKVAARWANGQWTYEVARKLVTGSQFDVQFDDMNKAYTFGFAAFDNAQVRHAMSYEVLTLRFAK
ncbi:MAG: ethylbenzene dehydrogenase-related protein [Burkholderiaceae bacterium]|jgi:hypothetical protein|nr:ethylbenzene dehydrogenase-related protein [Burkholderiaceae bacterium]